MTANIKLYQYCRLTPSNNFYCDDIQKHLNTLNEISIDEYNYVKINYKIEIKITIPQDFYDYKKICNYMTITQPEDSSERKTFYYYITSMEWVSQNTCKLVAVMDTMTTYWQDLKPLVSNRSVVSREHKDRIELYEKNIEQCTFLRKIDRVNEGITPNTYTNSANKIALQNENLKCYLMYKNRDNIDPEKPTTPNPVECFLIPNKRIKIADGTYVGDRSVTVDDLVSGKKYYFTISDNFNDFTCYFGQATDVNVGVTVVNKTFTFMNGEGEYRNETYKMATLEKQGSGLKLTLSSYDDNDNFLRIHEYTNVEGFLLKSSVMARLSTNKTNEYVVANTYTEIESFISGNEDEKFTKVIEDIDRTDSKIIKIIELPYYPVPFIEDEKRFNGFTYDDDSKLFKLDNLNIKFLYNNVANIKSNFYVKFAQEEYDLVTPRSIHKNTKIDNAYIFGLESKLCHSNFYFYKVVYDSFSKVIRYENIDNLPIVIDIDFKATSTMNSAFSFKINVDDIYQTEDFYKYINVKRNNELTLYNSAYVNYIRNGYNYDVKNKNRQIGMGILNTTLNVATSIAGFALSAYTGGLSIVAGIGAGASAIGSIANTISSSISAEENIQKQLQNLQAQSTSVQGSDDIDLLNYYSNNELLGMRYYISSRMQEELNKLFYYCGYASNVTKIPDFDSRMNFNYVQAKIVFYEEKYNEDIMKDIKDRFSVGITFLHPYDLSNEIYDFEQKYENIEYSVWHDLNDESFVSPLDIEIEELEEEGETITGILEGNEIPLVDKDTILENILRYDNTLKKIKEIVKIEDRITKIEEIKNNLRKIKSKVK